MNTSTIMEWTPQGRRGLAQLLTAYSAVLDALEQHGPDIQHATSGDLEWWNLLTLLELDRLTLATLCEGGKPLQERQSSIKEWLDVLASEPAIGG